MPCWFSLFPSLTVHFLSPALVLLLPTPNPVCCSIPISSLSALLLQSPTQRGLSALQPQIFYCHSHFSTSAPAFLLFFFLHQGLNPDLGPLAVKVQSPKPWTARAFPHRCPSFHLERSVPTLSYQTLAYLSFRLSPSSNFCVKFSLTSLAQMRLPSMSSYN